MSRFDFDPAQLFDESIPNVTDLHPNSTEARQGRVIGKLFTEIVQALRDVLPSKPINDLAAVFYALVGNRITPTVMAPVPSVSFSVAESKGVQRAVIAVPPHWVPMVVNDKDMQICALLSAASKSVDYFNGKFGFQAGTSVEAIRAKVRINNMRAAIYEAEYVKLVSSLPEHKFTPNAYQVELQKDFPLGFDTPLVDPAEPWLYKSMPVELGNTN